MKIKRKEPKPQPEPEATYTLKLSFEELSRIRVALYFHEEKMRRGSGFPATDSVVQELRRLHSAIYKGQMLTDFDEAGYL